MSRARLTRRLAYGLAALLALAAALLAAADWLVDTPAVKAAIQQRLSAALGGQITWEDLELRLLPAPRGELRKVSVEMPGAFSLRAEQVDAYLRLWPLLRGHPEIASLEVARPEIRIEGGGARDERAPLEPLAVYRKIMQPAVEVLRRFAPDTQLRIDGAAIGLEAAGLELRELNVAARTGDAGLDLEVQAASNLWKRLQVKGRVEYADLSARLEADILAPELLHGARVMAQLPAAGSLQVSAQLEGVRVASALAIARRWAPAVDVLASPEGRVTAGVDVSLGEAWRVDVQVAKSDAAVRLAALPSKISLARGRVAVTAKGLEASGVQGAVGESAVADAAARLEFGKPLRLSAASGRATLRLEQWLPWLRERLPLEEIGALSGSAEVTLQRLALRFDRPGEADFEALVAPQQLSATLRSLPWKLSVQSAHLSVTQKVVRVERLRGTLGESTFSNAAARLELGRPLRLTASGEATLRLEQWLPWLRERLPLEELAAASGAADVTLQRLALRLDRPAEADFAALVVPRQVSATLKALPGPVSASGGALRAGPQRLEIDKVALAMLDASAAVSGSVAYKGPAVELAAADGVLGEKAVQWAMQRAELSADLEPKAPLRFAARRVAWGPQNALDLDARIDFDHGPQVGVALGWRPRRLELRRATVKDALSDASFSATLADDSLQAGFAGRLDGRSIAAMLRHKLPSSGRAQGDLKLAIDRAQPARTRGDGHLALEALDLSWLAGRRLRIERAEVRSEQDDLRILRARLDVEEQMLSLQGTLRRTAQGPVVDARVESPGVDLGRLLPARKTAEEAPSKLWPLPATGRVEVSAGYLQTERYRIEPLEGVMTFERESARLDVKQARMCGVSFPLVAEVLPDKYSVSAVVTMKDEPFESAMRCLTGGTVEISGNADLRAELRTQGRNEAELIGNLSGPAQGELRKGRVKKFALIGNILSMRDIAALKDPKEGFAYRSLTASGRFERGEFLLEEGFFDSDAARLAANGRVDLQGPHSRLTVLVGLLTTVDRVVGAIPLIGDIFGGTMIALPVSVAGDIRDPQVVPLGPRAVSDQLLGIFERTLKLPTKLVPAKPAPP